MSVFQDLYNSEINFAVSTFWDGGFDIKLGDHANGFVAEETVDFFGQVEPWLIEQAVEHFPDSQFAAMYTGGWRGLHALSRPRRRKG